MKNPGVILMSLLLLCSCASQPAYRPAKGNGVGYKETALGDNNYRVEYQLGAGKVQKAQEFALIRAAEITSAQGYDWFVVTKSDTTRDGLCNREHAASAPLLSDREVVQRNCGLLGCRTSVQTIPDADFGPDDETACAVKAMVEISLGKGIRPIKNAYDAIEVLQTKP